MLKLFSRSKPKGQPFDFSLLNADMHSHLLPGIDDGAEDMENSLELIKGMRELGYKKLITTPHVMWDMYKNSPEIIREKLALVQGAVKNAGIDVEIKAAAEYFLDEHVEELLRNKEPLLTIKDNMVLTEFSMAFPSMNIKDILFEMQMQGYQTIIAHPERYVYLERNKDFYTELKDTGCYFQLNLLSLSGHYGRSVVDLAHYLLKNGFYNIVGTDLHHLGHLEGLQRFEMPPQLRKLLDEGQLLNPEL
ncbi:MAG: CpsB/CapC family capsule biosynthesis tyrosine phosphatase [Bacteroidota bacterium]|nr:CpsB/CapC family capsule biosynthesis tyrosine phosphatase [Bacteroidota bacterium]